MNAIITRMILLATGLLLAVGTIRADDLEQLFTSPPDSAKPGVLWMWMGSNVSKEGITRDLEALKDAGFGRTTMFSLADITTPWAGKIGNSPMPEIVSWTEPWWKLVRHAAEESKRLGMDFGMFNGPSYESSGGPWITPELSMQQICWSKTEVIGAARVSVALERPKVDLRAVQQFPVFNPETGKVENPEIPARRTFYRDVAVLALPAEGNVAREQVIDLSAKMASGGQLDWDAPAGKWTVYRFGHTTMGTLIQPAQWKATGFECDKMSVEAVTFHMNHVIGEIQKHLGDLVGTVFTHVHFDSYEAGTPSWTPKMREEFIKRRGYDLTPFFATFDNRIVGTAQETEKFKADFHDTILDLYNEVYFATIARMLHEAKLDFLCEPYGGPWRQDDIIPKVDRVMTEFWTGEFYKPQSSGQYCPLEVGPTVAALRKSGQNLIEAEAFTGWPDDSRWSETPAWLKPIGDAAFCAGINRLVLHRFVQQPWDDRYLPGATMGQWGTHFDRTQTWWEQGKAMVKYWHRCQALLLWGKFVEAPEDFSIFRPQGKVAIKCIHRHSGEADVYFVANTDRTAGSAWCTFRVSGKQPELWDPVTAVMRPLTQWAERDGKAFVPLEFAPAQSFFIVFRKQAQPTAAAAQGNFPMLKPLAEISGPWEVTFNPKWGGPENPVIFNAVKDWSKQSDFRILRDGYLVTKESALEDWTKRPELGIKYYSGAAIYRKSFDMPGSQIEDGQSRLYLDLGTVFHIANVRLNGRDLGVVWTPPWGVPLPAGLLKTSGNQLEIEIVNVWANRLIGDEQEPPDCEWLPGHMGGRFLKEFPDWFCKGTARPSKGRFCFTTWNYFTKTRHSFHPVCWVPCA